MFELIKKLKFWFTKRKILKIARKSGCDVDGDILNYNGKQYLVAEFIGLVKEVK